MPVVVFFGGNGHATARLEAARAAVERLAAAGEIAPFDLLEVPYPGFEGRPRAADAATFLRTLAGFTTTLCERPDAVVHATGIGALFAVTLRARRELGRAPIVLQGPVLWGLEHRWMPRLARRGLAPVIPRLFQSAAFQRHFLRKHLAAAPPADVAAAFFDGYARCAATADLFRWCGPAWLREVEAAVHEHRASLGRVQVWWGGRDRVVGPAELRWTEAALGVRWPELTFPGWGHYPMIEDPEGWARAVAATVPAEAAGMIGG
jgi:pimeloyl-ACP methyl ester carboxylesterase